MGAHSNKRGQALTETIITLPLLLTFLFTLSFLFYRTFIVLSTDQAVMDAFYCLDRMQPVQCKKQLENEIDKNLLFRESVEFFYKIADHPSPSKISVRIRFTSTFFKTLLPPARIEKELFLPIYFNLLRSSL